MTFFIRYFKFSNLRWWYTLIFLIIFSFNAPSSTKQNNRFVVADLNMLKLNKQNVKTFGYTYSFKNPGICVNVINIIKNLNRYIEIKNVLLYKNILHYESLLNRKIIFFIQFWWNLSHLIFPVVGWLSGFIALKQGEKVFFSHCY